MTDHVAMAAAAAGGGSGGMKKYVVTLQSYSTDSVKVELRLPEEELETPTAAAGIVDAPAPEWLQAAVAETVLERQALNFGSIGDSWRGLHERQRRSEADVLAAEQQLKDDSAFGAAVNANHPELELLVGGKHLGVIPNAFTAVLGSEAELDALLRLRGNGTIPEPSIAMCLPVQLATLETWAFKKDHYDPETRKVGADAGDELHAAVLAAAQAAVISQPESEQLPRIQKVCMLLDSEADKAICSLELHGVVQNVLNAFDHAWLEHAGKHRPKATHVLCSVGVWPEEAPSHVTLELPGGKRRLGESFDEAAEREFVEETGLAEATIVRAQACRHRFNPAGLVFAKPTAVAPGSGSGGGNSRTPEQIQRELRKTADDAAKSYAEKSKASQWASVLFRKGG